MMSVSARSFKAQITIRFYRSPGRGRSYGLLVLLTMLSLPVLTDTGSHVGCPGFASSVSAMGSRERNPGPAGRVAMAVAALEKEDYMIRADIWQKDVEPEVGKALRVQLFKGHSYVIVAIPVKGGEGSIEANVIDGTGRPVEQLNRAWRGATRLEFTPDGTGLYLVLVRNSSGEPVTAAVVIGYK